jgi:hypothetical protein
VAQHRLAVPGQVLAQRQARPGPHHDLGQHRPALDERSRSQILAVQLEEVEREQEAVKGVPGAQRRVKGEEVRHTIRSDHDGLAVHDRRADAQGRHSGDDRRKPVGVVEPRLREHLNDAFPDVALSPVAVVLDLVLPALASRNALRQRRLAWRDEPWGE